MSQSAVIRRHRLPERFEAVCRDCGTTWRGDRADADGSGHVFACSHVVTITATRSTVLKPQDVDA